MLDASFFLSLFAVIPALERTDEIASNATEAFKLRAKVLLVIFVVFLRGSFVAGSNQELRAELDETADVEVFVFTDGLEASRDIRIGNLCVFVERFFEAVEIKWGLVAWFKVEDVFHFLCPFISVANLSISAICSVVNSIFTLYVVFFHSFVVVYNKSMKIIEKKCPNCGGNLDFKVGERDVKCESCRRKFAVEYDADISDLSEKAMDMLKAADVSLRPVRRVFIVFFCAFFLIVAVAITMSVISMINSRNEFNKKYEQSQQEFEKNKQEMLESIGM